MQLDAEASYYVARTYAALGDFESAIREMTHVIGGGFLCHETFAHDPWLKKLHADPRLGPLLDAARERSAHAAAAFDRAGGRTLLSPCGDPWS